MKILSLLAPIGIGLLCTIGCKSDDEKPPAAESAVQPTGTSIEHLMSIVPSDALFVSAAQNLTSLMQTYGLVDKNKNLTFIEKGDLAQLEAQLKTTLQYSSFIKNAKLQDNGTGAIAALMHKNSPCGLLYLPSQDGAGTADFIVTTISGQGMPVAEMLDKTDTPNGELSMVKDVPIGVGWLAMNKWLVIGGCQNPDAAKSLLSSINTPVMKSMNEASWYGEVKGSLQGNWHLGGLLNSSVPKEQLQQLKDLITTLNPSLQSNEFQQQFDDIFNNFEVSTTTIEIGSDRVKVDVSGKYTKEGMGVLKKMDLSQDSTGLMNKIPGKPIAAVVSPINFDLVMENMTSQSGDIQEELNKLMNEFQREVGTDLEKNFLLQLGSPMGLAFIEEENPRAPFFFGGVMWVGLKDKNTIPVFLDKVTAFIQAEEDVEITKMQVNNNEWYNHNFQDFMNISYGVAENNFILAVGQGIPANIREKMGTNSLMSNIDGRLKGVISGEKFGSGFMDFKLLSKSLDTIQKDGIDVQEAADIVGAFDSLTMSTDISQKNNTFQMEVDLKAAKTDGFSALFKKEVLPRMKR